MRVLSLDFVVFIPLLFFPRLFFDLDSHLSECHFNISRFYLLSLLDYYVLPNLIPCLNYIPPKACIQKHFAMASIINIHVPFGFLE